MSKWTIAVLIMAIITIMIIFSKMFSSLTVGQELSGIYRAYVI